MKGLALVLLLSSAAVAADRRPKPDTFIYYVQLVRGTAADRSPLPGCKPVGPALAGRFHSVFKWRHYWEVRSARIEISPGQEKRVRLSTEREVEIDLRNPRVRTVAAFHKGNMIERTICPRSKDMTLIGGDNDRSSAWFVVVRRDKPGS